MARCPYLKYESAQGDYYCDLCKKTLSESEVKYKCNADSCENYKDCPVYKNR